MKGLCKELLNALISLKFISQLWIVKERASKMTKIPLQPLVHQN